MAIFRCKLGLVHQMGLVSRLFKNTKHIVSKCLNWEQYMNIA